MNSENKTKRRQQMTYNYRERYLVTNVIADVA